MTKWRYALKVGSDLFTPAKIVEELIKCGITHVIWLPDSETGAMYQALTSRSGLTVIPVCREGEALPIAAGLILGGKYPVVIHQNTGFFDTGNEVRGFALGYPLPILMLIGYRGWTRNAPMTDSAAIYFEPILKTWGIKYYMLESDAELGRISAAYQEAQKTGKPVAILIGKVDEES
jgi:phosphonopyruvate decarboxylase